MVTACVTWGHGAGRRCCSSTATSACRCGGGSGRNCASTRPSAKLTKPSCSSRVSPMARLRVCVHGMVVLAVHLPCTCHAPTHHMQRAPYTHGPPHALGQMRHVGHSKYSTAIVSTTPARHVRVKPHEEKHLLPLTRKGHVVETCHKERCAGQRRLVRRRRHRHRHRRSPRGRCPGLDGTPTLCGEARAQAELGARARRAVRARAWAGTLARARALAARQLGHRLGLQPLQCRGRVRRRAAAALIHGFEGLREQRIERGQLGVVEGGLQPVRDRGLQPRVIEGCNRV